MCGTVQQSLEEIKTDYRAENITFVFTHEILNKSLH